ncbi:helix-turn-helix domain-containing protein [Bradyrhizobium jicamae]|uniref:Helix-turn-helix domain-containing protein n=1 Tax=Bradyrhizobium jicamae TaxID=280332 RepID=A0ABS5FN70_9BRAD|nr:AraC family transcriptional regulator [Bradyrhizobium jicamae]MBR0798222.1 helix-turn-helix domain-containing protein [Bradyrhizobium jicamae]
MSASWSYRPYHRADGVEMGRLETARPMSQAAHFHDEIQVAAVCHGWRAYWTPRGEFRASAGDIVMIPSGLPHASHGSAASIIHLYLPCGHPAAHDVLVPQIIRGMRARSPGEIIDAVGSVRREGDLDDRHAATVVLPKQFLDQDIDVGAMAAQFGYSTDGFIRAFKRQFGMTPAAYRVAHRLTRARAQLKQGCAVADVAYATCFADQSHFGRLFRRAYGATPAAYRSAFTPACGVDFVPDRSRPPRLRSGHDVSPTT